ncbi:hypothetical protein AURDEDRAFT_20949, partial [Auricularia subglabra TFB-10046 SS5]
APFDIPGIGLRALRQKVAHRAIRRAAEVVARERQQTTVNLDKIKHSIEQNCGYRPTTTQIWEGLRSKDLSRTVRNFMWKGIHSAHKVGEYFAKMPEPWRSKKDCPSCGTMESMEHILFACADSGQEDVWQMAGE